MNDEPLSIWCIYDHPLDYPDCFVAVRWQLDKRTNDIVTAPTLEAVRAKLPRGLYLLKRFPNDDPKIVETWL